MPPATRSSPEKAGKTRSCKRGLPTESKRAEKKEKKSKKDDKKKKKTSTVKAVASAKKKVVEEEAKKNAPEEPVVKEEGATTRGRRLWTEQEDVAACHAYVNVTCDPTVGSAQKGDKFWSRVQEQMHVIYNKGSDCVVEDKKWNLKSVENRISKIIGRETQKFNAYWIQSKKEDDSGWTPEMHLDAACKAYLEVEGKQFKFKTCARILHKCPKYKPVNDPVNEDGDVGEKPRAVASIQGKGLPKPMGTKKAKKMAIVAKLEQESVASTAHTNAVMAVAKSTDRLNATFEKKRRVDAKLKLIDSKLKLANFYSKLEREEKADKLFAEVEAIQAEVEAMEKDLDKPAQPVTASVPTSIAVEEQEQQETSVDVTDEGLGMKNQEDEDEASEESHHSSQPSDDSLMVKKTAV